MIQTDKVLEFDKIKKMWSELALTDWAKRSEERRVGKEC